MSDETPVAAHPYDAILADLRSKRDAIDQAISSLEYLRSGDPKAPVASKPAIPADEPAAPGGQTNPGAFLGMTIVEAATAYLASQRRPLGNAAMYSAFKAGGMVLTSADPVNVISSVLARRFNNVGDIVRVGRGTWGLAEWYPNRNFRKKAPSEEKVEAALSALTQEVDKLLKNDTPPEETEQADQPTVFN